MNPVILNAGGNQELKVAVTRRDLSLLLGMLVDDCIDSACAGPLHCTSHILANVSSLALPFSKQVFRPGTRIAQREGGSHRR
jgi:hypothetical protein